MSVRSLVRADIEALRQIDTATITNAMDTFDADKPTVGYEYSSLELRCLLPELPPMVGYAVTCTGDSTSPRTPGRKSRMRQLYEAIRDSDKPVVVVCQNVGPDRLRSNHFGDIMATTFQRLGAVGAVTDGGIRDLAGVRERAPGFQMFAPGAVPSGGIAYIVDVGVPVSVGGMSISPGDLIHGDANGLVVIPPAIADQIPEKAQAVLDKERDKVAFITSDEYSLEEHARRSGWD
jgi:regulator of RNase E activity RraA